jgi:hypothetical protein
MKMTRGVIFALLIVALALPAFGKHYKNTYPVACTEIWPAVNETLSNKDNYDVVEKDDAKMTATYDVKHQVHTNVSGALLQRKNKVALLPKGTGCELDVVSNYSGWEHDDHGDFKKRVDEAMTKPKAAPAAQATAPAPPAK